MLEIASLIAIKTYRTIIAMIQIDVSRISINFFIVSPS